MSKLETIPLLPVRTYDDPEQPPAAAGPPRSLGFLSIVFICYFLVCGGAYGTEDIGGAIPPLLGILGCILMPWVWSLPLGLISAELASALPDDGGFLVWTREAWGEGLSFIEGWIMLIVVIVDQAIYPVIFAGYFEALVGDLDFGMKYLVSFIYVVVGGAIACSGMGSVGVSAQIFGALALAPLVIFTISAFVSDRFDHTRLMSTTMTEGQEAQFALYFSVVLWAQTGFEYSAFLINDMKKPSRYPYAIIVVVVLLLITYLPPIVAAIGVAESQADITDGAFPDLANLLGFGPWIAYTLVAGGLVSTMGTFNAYLTTTANALRGRARQGQAPMFFALLPKYRAPIVGIIFFCVTTAGFCLLDFSALVEAEAFLISIHVIVMCSAFLKLRWSRPHPQLNRTFYLSKHWPVGIIAAVLPCLCSVAMMVFSIMDSGWTYLVMAIGVLVVGGLILAAKEFQRRRTLLKQPAG